MTETRPFQRSAKSPPTEGALLAYLEDLLRSRLPSTWQVAVSSDWLPPSLWLRPDALLSLTAPNQRVARLAVEAKRVLYPKDVYGLAPESPWLGGGARQSLGRSPEIPYADGILLLSPYLGADTRELLARSGFSYADATGNMRLTVSDPPMFIELTGAKSNPWREDRPLRSLRGASSGRVVRALLDFRPPYRLRDLAEAASLSLATASRAVAYLIDEALVVRSVERGPIEIVDWVSLLRRWVKDYGMFESNETELYFDPRGPLAVIPKLAKLDSRYAVTGSLAAIAKAPVASPALAAVYVDDFRAASERLGLRQVGSGGNVVLLRSRSAAPYDRTWTEAGVVYAGLSQVAADLLTAPGRGPSEGEALISWMEENEDGWRRTGPSLR